MKGWLLTLGGGPGGGEQLLGDLADAAGGVPAVGGDFALGELAGGVVGAAGADAAAAGACGEGPGPAGGDGGGVMEEIRLQTLRDGRRQLLN